MTSPGGDEWEAIGRELLAYQLEEHGESIGTAFRDAATRISRGDSVDDLDTERLRVLLEQADGFLDTVEDPPEP